MERIEKLEKLIKIEERIQSYLNRIEIAEEIIENEGSYFRDIRDTYTNKKDKYERCIESLNDRFRKLVLTLK